MFLKIYVHDSITNEFLENSAYKAQHSPDFFKVLRHNFSHGDKYVGKDSWLHELGVVPQNVHVTNLQHTLSMTEPIAYKS
jgi:hypothetical protein